MCSAGLVPVCQAWCCFIPAAGLSCPAALPASQVNKIREIPKEPHIIVSHTDAQELYVWNTEKQPSRAGEKVRSAARLALLDEQWAA